MCACDGDSGSEAPFAGIRRTYVVAGGDRTLALDGTSGTYRVTTPGGTQSLPVVLGADDLTIGARSVPYLAEGALIIGGGYAGFAADTVVSDPREVAGTYTTMTGANFAGELRLGVSGDYVWCMRSRIGGESCADGSAPNRGATRAQAPLGFSFAGVLGTYAIHRQGGAAAIFPVSAQSLRLMAFSQPLEAPSGSFSQPPASATAQQVATTVTFEPGSVEIRGEPAWSGTYDYSIASGVIQFASEQCPDGVCNAIYNDELGLLYVARLGNGLFVR